MSTNADFELGSRADAIAQNGQVLSFPKARRRPLLRFCTFVLLPLPAFVVLCVAMLFVLGGIVKVLHLDEHVRARAAEPGTMDAQIADAVLTGIVAASAAAAALLFCRLARRTGSHWGWAAIACALVVLCSASAVHNVRFAAVAGQSSLSLGLGIGVFTLSQLVQAAVPLATILLEVLARRSVAKRGTGTPRQVDHDQPRAAAA